MNIDFFINYYDSFPLLFTFYDLISKFFLIYIIFLMKIQGGPLKFDKAREGNERNK